MPLNLTQKERALLEDQKSHEEVCVQKYTAYANSAQCPQLKQMFQTYAAHEQEHLNSINQLLNGQIPQMGQQQGQQMQQQNTAPAGSQATFQGNAGNQNDAVLCNDMLMTEKYVSSTYDTAIFEQADSNVRQVLNHIQKEEQGHGEGIFKYMQSKGMYNPK
jgi:spore coat protein CotF